MTEEAEDVDDVEVAGYAVNEEVVDGEVGGAGAEVDGDELDPMPVFSAAFAYLVFSLL